MKRLFLAIFLFSMTASATLNEVDKTQIFSKNLLKNGGFENGKALWTASAGTFTVTGTSPMIGLYHSTWDAAASADTLSSTAVAIPTGMYGVNAVASCLIKTPSGTATHFLQAYDGTNVLSSDTVFSNTVPVRKSVLFQMPSTGNIILRIYANADEPSITIDDCYLGPAEGYNMGFTMPQDVFGAKVSATDVVSDENSNWINGDCTNATTGQSTCTFVSGIFTTSPNCTCSLAAGTNGECTINTVSSSSVLVVQQNSAGTSTNSPFQLSCQKTGVDEIQPSLRPDQVAMSWSGYHSGSDCSFARAGAAYADPTVDATCTFTERTNTNFGTVTSYLSGGDKLPGIVFTPKRAGKYSVCATINTAQSATGGTGIYQLWDGTTIINQVRRTSTANFLHNNAICGIYNATSTSAVSLRIRVGVDTGTGSISGTADINAVEWSVIGIDQQLPAPLLVNSVVNTRSGVTGIVSAYITNAGTPTISSQDGSWISSLTDNGTGDTTINIISGTFSSTPRCFCSIHVNAAMGACVIDTSTAPSSTVMRIQTSNIAGTASDNDIYVMCIGAK